MISGIWKPNLLNILNNREESFYYRSKKKMFLYRLDFFFFFVGSVCFYKEASNLHLLKSTDPTKMNRFL